MEFFDEWRGLTAINKLANIVHLALGLECDSNVPLKYAIRWADEDLIKEAFELLQYQVDIKMCSKFIKYCIHAIGLDKLTAYYFDRLHKEEDTVLYPIVGMIIYNIVLEKSFSQLMKTVYMHKQPIIFLYHNCRSIEFWDTIPCPLCTYQTYIENALCSLNSEGRIWKFEKIICENYTKYFPNGNILQIPPDHENFEAYIYDIIQRPLIACGFMTPKIDLLLHQILKEV